MKLLALARGRRLHREQLMDTLWPDRSPAAAANNLHQAVHAARRALGADAVVVRDEVLQLIADVDVDRFERAAGEARRLRTPRACRAALDLYAGELLPENRYDDWAESRRAKSSQSSSASSRAARGPAAAAWRRSLQTRARSSAGAESSRSWTSSWPTPGC